MLVVRDLSELPAGWGPSAVTIGKFDGVHLGHRAVIDRLRARADEGGLASVVVTFDRHPLAVLAPGREPEAITSLAQKIELLAETGVDAVVVLTFDERLRSEEPEHFVDRVLVGALAARVVLVGPDFRFGARGRGDVALLARLGAERGFVVEPVPEVDGPDGRPVSSTRVRERLEEGDVVGAARLLGRNPVVRAVVVHGEKRGRELGYPTANLSPEREGFLPRDGVYAGYLRYRGERMPAAISIGNNPTFEGVPARQAEAWVLDRELDLYDQVVELEFTDYLRPMQKYDGVEALVAQLHRDEQRVRELLAPATVLPRADTRSS